MIQQKRPNARSFRFFLFCGGLLLVATLYTAYAQLYLLPPKLAADVGQTSPILFQGYQWLWEQARHLGRWGVREGLFDPKIREFGVNGIPAYFINLIGGLAAALLAVFTGLIGLLSRPGIPAAEEPSFASPTQQEDALLPERKMFILGKAQGPLPSTWRDALDESHRSINEAQGVLQRLQRSALNLALTHPSAEAGDDVTEVHLAMASLDRLLRTIKSSQADISEQLAHLNADHHPSRGAGTS